MIQGNRASIQLTPSVTTGSVPVKHYLTTIVTTGLVPVGHYLCTTEPANPFSPAPDAENFSTLIRMFCRRDGVGGGRRYPSTQLANTSPTGTELGGRIAGINVVH